MAINILQLKQQKIRKTFKIGDDSVEVYNITSQNRHLFDEIFESGMNYETGEVNLTDDKVLLGIYTALTNIEFDKSEEVLEALENPSVELEMINNEIRMIITEFANSKIQDQLTKIQELELLLNQAELTGVTEKVATRAGLDVDHEVKVAQEQLTGMRSSKKAGKKNAGKTAN